MVGQHTGSLMRQAVCIALKYHKEPTVKRERRRSLRTSQSSYAGKSAIDFEAWVDEVRGEKLRGAKRRAGNTIITRVTMRSEATSIKNTLN